MAFIDLDEFLFSPRMVPVPEVLGDYENLPAAAALWIVFGTSGYKTPPPGLVLENYTWRRIWPRRPRRVEEHRRPAAHAARLSRARVSLHRSGMRGPVPEFASLDDLRLNHYIMKSEQELKVKLEQPHVTGGKGRAGDSRRCCGPTGMRRGDDPSVRARPAGGARCPGMSTRTAVPVQDRV